MKKNLAPLAAIIFVTTPVLAQQPTPAAGPRFYFTDTGIDSVANPEVPGSVNNQGSAVGTVYDAVSTSGAYWKPDFGAQNKVALIKTATADANYANDESDYFDENWPAEDIVGKAVTYSFGNPVSSAPVVWITYGGTPQKKPASGYDWGSFRSCDVTTFTNVSQAVRAVGYASTSETGVRVPIWWKHGDTGSSVLQPPSGSWGGTYLSGEAMDINSSGVIVGYLVKVIDSVSYTLPCRWLPDPADGSYGAAQILPKWPSDPANGLVQAIARAVSEPLSSTLGDEYIEGTTVSTPKAFTYKYTAHTDSHVIEVHDYTDQGWKIEGQTAVATFANPLIGYFLFSSESAARPTGNKLWNDIDGLKGHNQVLAQQMYDAHPTTISGDWVVTTTGTSPRLYVGKEKETYIVSLKDKDSAGYDTYQVTAGTAQNTNRPVSPFDDWVDELVSGYDNVSVFKITRGPAPSSDAANVRVEFTGNFDTFTVAPFTFQFSGRVDANADIRAGVKIKNYSTGAWEPSTIDYQPIRTAWKSYTTSVTSSANYVSGGKMQGRVSVKFFGLIAPAVWSAEIDQILFIWDKP